MAFRVQDILQWVPGRLANAESLGNRVSEITVERMTGLTGSTVRDLCFFFSKEYQAEVPEARPGILITGEPFVQPLSQLGLPLWKDSAVIATADPYGAMAILSEKFAALQSTVAHVPASREGAALEVHPTAVVSAKAKLGKGARIGAHCVIEDGAILEEGCVLYPGCYVGPSAKVGAQSVLFPRVTIYENVEIGSRVRIHAGTVVGSDGFGYAPDLQNGKPVGHRKIYHLGRVVIGDDVEIGANCTIDRATLGETRIGAMSKLDNDVHIAHNTVVGRGAIFCGNSSTAGGAKVGNFVYIGGMSGVTNRAVVGDYAKVAGMTGVSKNVAPGAVVSGVPHRDYSDYFRLNALFNRMLKQNKRAGKSDASTEE